MKKKLLLLLAVFICVMQANAQVDLQRLIRKERTESKKDTILYILKDDNPSLMSLTAVLDSISKKTAQAQVKKKVGLIVTPHIVLQLNKNIDPVEGKPYYCYGIYFKSGARLTWNYSTNKDHPMGWSHLVYVNIVAKNKTERGEALHLLDANLNLLLKDVESGDWHAEVVSSKGYN